MRTGEAERRSLLELDKRARLSQLRRHHATMRRRRRRQVSTAWYTVDSEALQDPAALARSSAASGARSTRPPAPMKRRPLTFFGFVQVWDGGMWTWERGCTRDLAASVRSSSPRRNGLNDAFWGDAPPLAHSMLDNMAERAQDGVSFPTNCKSSVAVTIPTGEVLEGEMAIRLTAPTIRPIALMQTGCKLIPLRENCHLCAVAEAAIAEPQKGLERGRRIEDCVEGFDGACAVASLQCGRGVVGILFHFAHACPSFAQTWIFLVLRRMAMAPLLIKLIQAAMFAGNTTTF